MLGNESASDKTFEQPATLLLLMSDKHPEGGTPVLEFSSFGANRTRDGLQNESLWS